MRLEYKVKHLGCEDVEFLAEVLQNIDSFVFQKNGKGEKRPDIKDIPPHSIKHLELNFETVEEKVYNIMVQSLSMNSSIQHITLIGAKRYEPVMFVEILERISTVQTLKLPGYRFGREGCIALTTSLEKMTNLHELDLSWNEIGREGCVILASALSNMTSLQTLNLSGNKIGKEGCITLTNALLSMTSLQTLNLSANMIGKEGCIVLSNALVNVTSLRALHLSGNKIGKEGCIALGNTLSDLISLQALHLSGNNIGKEGCIALASNLVNMTSLQTLNLSANEIMTEGCIALASALSSMICLQTLYLSANNIGKESCIPLASSVGKMTNLKTLDVSRNMIGKEGCIAFASALSNMASLETMDISSNLIGNEGCIALASALENAGSLQTLDLSVNEIGDEGCIALASALANMSCLQTLELSENVIGNEASKHIAQALLTSRSIRALMLSKNQIGSCGVHVIMNHLSISDRQMRVELCGNPVTLYHGSVNLMEYSASLIKAGKLACDFGRMKDDPTTIGNIIGSEEAKISARLFIDQSIEFDKLELIGRGTFGGVYKLNDRLAVKRLYPVPKKEAKRVLQELKNWSEIKSMEEDFLFDDCLVRFEGLTFPSDQREEMIELAFVMPLYDCTLREHIQSELDLSFERRVSLLYNVSRGLSTLHQLNIIHRDLHSRNVLVHRRTGRPKAAISDFGLSKLLQVEEYEGSEYPVTVSFGSNTAMYKQIRPDEVEYDEKCGFGSDVYAFGVLMWEVMYGLNLNGYDKQTPLRQWIEEDIKNRTLHPWKDKSFNELMLKCLGKYENRPTSNMLMETLDLLQSFEGQKEIDCGKLLRIGQGRFGEVFKASGSLAIKRFFHFSIAIRDRVIRSLEIWYQVKELPGIVQFERRPVFPVDPMDVKVCYLMPWYDSSLKDYLKSGPNFDAKIDILCQISAVLELLHSQGVTHSNLHSGNVLVKAKEIGMIADLSDIGMCSYEDNETFNDLMISDGSNSWKVRIPPPAENSEFPAVESDVYSFGLLMWECMYGIKLDGYENQCPLGKWIRGNLGKRFFDSSEEMLNQILFKCLEENVAKRPTARHLKEQLDAIRTKVV
jgi:serine/threonine protein kinase/Ran GTPase-activating protein (RanGAP) involved in mRNA processing and transport